MRPACEAPATLAELRRDFDVLIVATSSFGEGVSQEEMMRRAEEMFDTVFEELMQSLDGGGIEEIVDTMLGPAKVSTSTRTRASTSK